MGRPGQANKENCRQAQHNRQHRKRVFARAAESLAGVPIREILKSGFARTRHPGAGMEKFSGK